MPEQLLVLHMPKPIITSARPETISRPETIRNIGRAARSGSRVMHNRPLLKPAACSELLAAAPEAVARPKSIGSARVVRAPPLLTGASFGICEPPAHSVTAGKCGGARLGVHASRSVPVGMSTPAAMAAETATAAAGSGGAD
jgi:hypothetical protein